MVYANTKVDTRMTMGDVFLFLLSPVRGQAWLFLRALGSKGGLVAYRQLEPSYGHRTW